MTLYRDFCQLQFIVLFSVMVAVAVMFSFCAIQPLPTKQDIESESDLLTFSVAEDKNDQCCDDRSMDSFILHTAAHRASTVDWGKSERDICNDMLAVLTEKSARGHMISRKCTEYLKEFAEVAPVKTLQQFRELLEKGGGPAERRANVLVHLALATGMHISIFYKFTVWTTRAISGEIGCLLRFAKMPGGRWVALRDAQPSDFRVPLPQSEDEAVASEGVDTRVMPTSTVCETVVKQEKGVSLVDGLFAAYEAAFPPCEESNEIEMKEVVCDHRLLAHPVVVVERMSVEAHTKSLDQAAADESDKNAALVPLPSRHDSKVQRVVTRSRMKKKTVKTGTDRSCVSASNIVHERRHRGRMSEVIMRSRSHQVKPSCVVGSSYKHRSLHRVHCVYCQFECHEVNMYKQHLCENHSMYVCNFALCISNWVSKGACAAHEELHRTATLRCDHCGWYTTGKAEFDRHVLKHTGDTPWTCKEKGCGRSFKRKGDLTAHELTHIDSSDSVSMFSCNKCSYSSNQKWYVTYHMRKHEKPQVTCELCGTVFRYFQDKKRHLARGCTK